MKKLLHLSLGLACVSACAETEESIGTLVHEDGPRSSWASSLAEQGRADGILGRDPDGHLALVRLGDGTVVTRFAMGDLDGIPDASAFVREDGSLSHVALLAHDQDEQAGLLRLVPASSNGFARPVEVAELNGSTRTLALEGGALVMQDDLGQRWSFARRDGQFQMTTSCPRPASIIAFDSDVSGAAVLAIGWSSDGEAALIDAALVDDVWQCGVYPLSAPTALSESVRATMVPSIGTVLVDASEAGLRFASVGGTEVGAFSYGRFGARRVEQIEPWELEGKRGVIVLSSQPSAVTLLTIERRMGSTLTVVDEATVLLPFVSESSWFSRELLVTADQVYVATDGGLIGFELALDPVVGLHQVTLPPHLRDLRGPLVAVPRLPATVAAESRRDQSRQE